MMTITKRMTIAAAFAAMAASAIAGYHHETTLTVAGYHDAESLANFPLLVRISETSIPGFAYADCQADGKDIQFTSLDGTVIYPHEIDEWHTDGVSLVWVRIPSLTAQAQFKFQYGDPALTAAPAYTTSGATWRDAGYFGVFHLGETANSGTSSFKALDSSSYKFHASAARGSSNTSYAKNVSTTGIVGGGRSLATTATGKGNYLLGKNYQLLGVGDTFTVSGWFYMLGNGLNVQGNRVLFSRVSSLGGSGWSVNAAAKNFFYVYGGGGTQHTVSFGLSSTGFIGSWMHIAVVFEGTTAKFYYNGVLRKTITITAVPENNQAFAIGNSAGGGNASPEGKLDEIHFCDAVLPSAWIKAEWASQVSNDYVTASAAVARSVADTITVSSSSGYQIGTVTPPYGMSTLSAGTVTCTAPSGDLQATETSKHLYTGYILTQIDANGTATVTTNAGTTCTFTHVAGTSANLVWLNNRYFLVSATSSDPAKGSVTGAGWVAEGTTATLTPVANSGYEFDGWTSSDLLSNQKTTNPLTIRVTGPFSATAAFCGLRYKWKTYASGNWNAAANWADIDGNGTGDIPPNDGTAIVLLPFGGSGKSYTITLSGAYASVNVKGFYLKPYSGSYGGSTGNAVTLKGTSVTIGEEGIMTDDTINTVGIKFNANVNVPVSQTWKNKGSNPAGNNEVNNNTLELQKKLILPEGVVLTVAGTTPLAPNVTDTSDWKGTLRTNCRINYSATSALSLLKPPGLLELYAANTPYAGGYGWLMRSTATGSGEIKIVAPIRLDSAGTTKLLRVQLQVAEAIAGNAWNYNWAAPLSGVFADRKVSFGNVMTSTSQHRSHHPEKQRNYFTCDSSALVTNGLPAFCFPHGVFTMAAPNALGAGNVLGAYFGGDDFAGYYTGLLATNNITVRSNMALGKDSLYVLLGMLDPGEAFFTGDFTGNVAARVYLNAPPGGKVHFSGTFTMNEASKNNPLEVTGGGEVHLEGDNSAVTQKSLDVRSATAVLGHANAAGTKAVTLGGTVPVEIPVRVYADRRFKDFDTKITEVTSARLAWKTSGTAFIIDGVTLGPGDKVLYTPDIADGSYSRIYQVNATGTQMDICDTANYVAGARIVVTNGTEYAGRAFMVQSVTTGASGTINCVNDEPEPDVALLAKGGVTVANGIQVTDNLSSGTSTIGGYDATNNTFSGAITLARDVAFRAPAGGVIRLTGSISDAAETLNAFAFTGTGTVELPAGTELLSRPVSFPGLTDEALAATGQTRCTLVTAPSGLNLSAISEPPLSKWHLRVKPASIIAFKNSATLLMVQ